MNPNPEIFYAGLCFFLIVIIFILIRSAIYLPKPDPRIDIDKPAGPYIKDGLLYVPCSSCGRSGLYPLGYDRPLIPVRCFSCWTTDNPPPVAEKEK
jgi:hypothetical protein